MVWTVLALLRRQPVSHQHRHQCGRGDCLRSAAVPPLRSHRLCVAARQRPQRCVVIESHSILAISIEFQLCRLLSPVVLTLPNTTRANKPALRGGGLGSDTYIFEAMHFHWGNDDSHGSEHFVNSKPYASSMKSRLFD